MLWFPWLDDPSIGPAAPRILNNFLAHSSGGVAAAARWHRG
ncbi:hypothetical protein I551_6477 [Mycobacterium ulcerans str. Harvey]|uniref:Uncharacterized protein n=1 Tax=Mycobacterium ulcerans str. Harvey TaxID=1299332 RepID=A0ABN0QQX6_MYCUL|nr:hypothetical protein I551_6477 [Mycobacterium ulcerans str. Harvey]